MNKKLLFLGLLIGIFAAIATTSHAQTDYASADISAILEENDLHEAFARYTSVLVYFQPEEASRLGFTSANGRLNDRSAQTDTQTLQALESVRKTLQEINPKNLSAGKRIEYHLFQDLLQRNIWSLQQNRLMQNPLYYAQALDALFDILQQPATNPLAQRSELLGRLEALPNVYAQAQKNLSLVSPRMARLAMEKAYYAYLSFDTIKEHVTNKGELTTDTRDTVKIENALTKAKASISNLFELFKNLSKDSLALTTTISPKDYAQKLNHYYQITQKTDQVAAELNTRWDEAQHQLFEALRPFELSADEEEMVIVEDLNQRPQEKLPAKKDKTTLEYVPPTANQFYAVAGQLVSSFTSENLLEQFAAQTNAQSAALLKQNALVGPVPVKIQSLLPYFAYQKKFLTYPAFSAFWLRVPTGNELAKTEALNRDFNEPAAKLFISEEIIPGRFYQAQAQKNRMRRLFGSPLLANGWTLYALRVAQQANVFVTDEELLFAAWQRFVRTVSAVVDYRFNTQQYTYEEALNFLTEQNGFAPETATQMVDDVLSNPGEAVSYVLGEGIWQENADKYFKKEKDYNAVTAWLLEMGNVSPADVPGELKRLYRNK